MRSFTVTLFSLVVCMGVTYAVPLESTTVGILIPPPSDDDSDDDAVVIEAGGKDDEAKDSTPENFDTKDCLLPKTKGPCKAAIESWFYSTITKSCEPFVWSGCGGNNNRFSEKEFCETHCSKEKLTAPRASTETPILFPGKNNGSEENPKVPIGSVSGNPDVSESPKPVGKPEDVCNLPETRGDCRAMLTRWRYNPEVKECVQFHFGGCDGNSNNFVSQEKCNSFCKGQ